MVHVYNRFPSRIFNTNFIINILRDDSYEMREYAISISYPTTFDNLILLPVIGYSRYEFIALDGHFMAASTRQSEIKDEELFIGLGLEYVIA